MLNQKELTAILTATIILSIVVSLVESWTILLTTFGVILLVILINVFVKKITAHHYDSHITVSLWEFSRYWYFPNGKFKKPILAGVIIPLAVKFLSVGLLNWMACLVFEIKAKTYRAARRRGNYSFSEVTEEEMGIIAAIPIIVHLIMGVAGYLTEFSLFSKINLAYAFYNLIPISKLDGAKIFFGNKLLWAALMTITSIGALISILMI